VPDPFAERPARLLGATRIDNVCGAGILTNMPPDLGTPEGYHTLTPRMVVTDVAGAVEFLRATFNASGDVVAGRPAEIRIGDSLVMVAPVGERDLFPALLYVTLLTPTRPTGGRWSREP
jgi:hypothetical protein